MRKFYKPLSVLLALSMCVSMIAPAFADYEEKVNPGYDIQNHPDYTPAEVEGVLDNKEPEKDDSISAVIDVIMDKVDQEALGEDAADDLNKVSDLLEAIDQADAADQFQQAVTDAVSTVPEKKAEAQTEENEDNTTPSGETIPVTEIKLTPATDEDGNEVKDPDGNQVMVPDVTITNGNGDVVKDEDNKPVTIDKFAQDKATEVGTAKEVAETAAGKAADALQKATELASTEVSPEDAAQAREELAAAQQEASDAYEEATEAAKTAAENYALAEDAVKSANRAYQEAIDKLHEAGYKLGSEDEVFAEGVDPEKLAKLDSDGGKAALEEAKKAVDDAKLALADAAALKAAAEKQRDYAELYNALAQTITGKYSEENVDKENFLTETLKKLNTAAGKYGQMNEDQLEFTLGLLIGTGEGALGGRGGYVEAWLNTEEGKKFMEEYTAKKAEIEEWEIKDKNLNQFFPGYKDDNGNIVAFWKGENGKDIPLGDGDLLYKLYFYTFQGGVTGNALNPDLGVYSQYTKELQNDLKQYLEAEEFLKAVEKGEDATIKAGNQEISYSKDRVEMTFNGGEKQTYTPAYDEDGKYLGVKMVFGNDQNGQVIEVPWETFVATIQPQVQTEMANQLKQAYTDFFVKKSGVVKKTEYQRLKDLVKANPGEHKELDTFMTYLDFLQYELQFREKNMAYGAAWDQYKTIVDNTNVVDLLLSGYQKGIPALIEDLEESSNAEDQNVAKILQSMLNGEPSDEIASFIFKYKDALEDPQFKKESQAIIYQTIKAHAEAKQAEAAKAQEALDTANTRYETAAEKVKDAQKKLDELLAKVNDGKTWFTNAVETAKQQLAAAQDALTAAEANRDAALAAQQQAEADYTTAMRLAIAVIDDSGNGGSTGGTGTTTGGTGDGGDSGVSIEDQAVPLAGLVTRAEFVNYLYERMGKPETALSTFTDVPEDHEYALAIGWGQASGLVAGYGDGTFRPDELVIVADVRIILGNYARVFGANAVAAADLKTLTGENDEIVMNSGEVLAEFFGEEYVSAEAEDAETAA